MNEPKRVTWKIVVGAILTFAAGSNLPMSMSGSTQANAGLAMSILAILGGVYLIYRGLYPNSK